MVEKFASPEGTTPILDSSGLIPTWVHTIQDLNRVEAENILNAQRKYLRISVKDPQKWFHSTELKAIHQAMFGDVWDWAGTYRKSHTSIGIKQSMIPSQLMEFCLEVHSWMSHPVELTFLEMAARIHHRLVFIHPFENGNGRFSRLVADRFLLALRCQHPIWPSQLNQEGVLRQDYIQTLKSADKGDYEPLIEYMQKLGAKDPDLIELLNSKFYRISFLKALLRRGANPNSSSDSGHAILQLAVKSNLKEVVEILIEYGAEIHTKDKTGLTPLQVALKKKNMNIADFLISKGAV